MQGRVLTSYALRALLRVYMIRRTTNPSTFPYDTRVRLYKQPQCNKQTASNNLYYYIVVQVYTEKTYTHTWLRVAAFSQTFPRHTYVGSVCHHVDIYIQTYTTLCRWLFLRTISRPGVRILFSVFAFIGSGFIPV